jgi:transposase
MEALAARPAPGRPAKLAPVHHARLERCLLAGAQAAGFAHELWTCPRVAELIKQEFGVRYHADHIGRLLRRLGWTPQRPVRRARQRDEARIQQWIKADWPRLKKKPAG